MRPSLDEEGEIFPSPPEHGYWILQLSEESTQTRESTTHPSSHLLKLPVLMPAPDSPDNMTPLMRQASNGVRWQAASPRRLVGLVLPAC